MGVYYVSGSTCLQVSHQYVFENGLFQLSGGTNCLFATLIWLVIERVYVVYSSLQEIWVIVPFCTAQKMKFSIKDFFSKCDQIHRKLNAKLHCLCSVGIGWPRFFLRVATTMISKRFVKLGIKVYFWI